MKIVYGNLGPFSLAVLFFLYCVYMKAGRPVYLAKNVVDESDEKPGVPMHRTDRVADIDRLNTQLDKSYVAALVDHFNNEKVRQDDPRLIKLIRDHFIEPPSPLPYQLNNISRVHFSQFNQAAIVDTMLNNMMAFNKNKGNGRLLHDEAKQWIAHHGHRKDETQVQCFPLYSILLALNQTNVDYLSLDIKGDELYALKTVPFDELHFKIMTVETNHPVNRSVDNKAFMESQGYQYVKNIAVDMVFVGKDT